MARIDGAAALKLDFGGMTTTTRLVSPRRGSLRLASSGQLRAPGKYKVLEHQRRQAQIRARRLLAIMAGE